MHILRLHNRPLEWVGPQTLLPFSRLSTVMDVLFFIIVIVIILVIVIGQHSHACTVFIIVIVIILAIFIGQHSHACTVFSCHLTAL